MKINSAVAGVIATLGLFVVFAYAQQSSSPSDPGMQPGMSGQQQSSSAIQDPQTVREIQQALIDQGYKVGAVDGKWGSKSQQALKKFQQAEGMEPTGQINDEVLAALGVSSEGAATGGQEDSMDQQSGAGGQQDSMDQQSGAGGQQDTMDPQSGAGGQQDSMDQPSGQSSESPQSSGTP